MFLSGCTILHPRGQSAGSDFSATLPTLAEFWFLTAVLIEVKWYLTVVLI